ncbi:MAG: F0F1 ATP synthase subunit B [Lactovum sp.]
MLLTEATPNTIVGNVIVVTGAFLILVVLLRLFVWDNITDIFAARTKKITDDISAAEEANQKANELFEKREEELAQTRVDAAGIIEVANETANQNREKLLSATNTEVKVMKEQATTEIELERQEALNSVKGQVADISVQIAEKLIGRSLDNQAQSDLIDSYLSKLES